MCLSHEQVLSKVYMSKLNFYLSQTIEHIRFWHTLRGRLVKETISVYFITMHPQEKITDSHFWIF